MKRKRWLAMALVFCLLGTTVPLAALAAGEDGEVQYIVSNDGTTLTIQGDGEITSQALDANVTAEQKKTLTSVEIGAGVTGIADGYSSVFPAGVTNVTLKGSGAFRFGKYSFKGQKNLTVQSERTSLAIGSYAFHNAVLTEFQWTNCIPLEAMGFPMRFCRWRGDADAADRGPGGCGGTVPGHFCGELCVQRRKK